MIPKNYTNHLKSYYGFTDAYRKSTEHSSRVILS